MQSNCLGGAMDTIVLYRSGTGFTEKYARWIAEGLGCGCWDARDWKKVELQRCSVVVYGGSLHASGIYGLRGFKKRLARLKLRPERLVVFAVGATPREDGLEEKLYEANFIGDEPYEVKLFYMRGGFNYERLSPLNKMLMTLMRKKLEAIPESERTADERGMLAAYSRPLDFTSVKQTEGLIAEVAEVGSDTSTI